MSEDEIEAIKKKMLENILKEDLVQEDDIVQALQFMKEMRLYAINMNMDPWAIRQALILSLEMDKIAIIERGVPQEKVEQFDREVRRDLKSWLNLNKNGKESPTGSQEL